MYTHVVSAYTCPCIYNVFAPRLRNVRFSVYVMLAQVALVGRPVFKQIVYAVFTNYRYCVTMPVLMLVCAAVFTL